TASTRRQRYQDRFDRGQSPGPSLRQTRLPCGSAPHSLRQRNSFTNLLHLPLHSIICNGEPGPPPANAGRTAERRTPRPAGRTPATSDGRVPATTHTPRGAPSWTATTSPGSCAARDTTGIGQL